MTKFTPLIDGNTKTVLQWTMINDSGEEVSKSVPKNLWKQQKDWDEEEIYNFFNLTNETLKHEEPIVLEDIQEELEDTEELENLEDRIDELTEELDEIKEHIEKKTFLEN